MKKMFVLLLLAAMCSNTYAMTQKDSCVMDCSMEHAKRLMMCEETVKPKYVGQCQDKSVDMLYACIRACGCDPDKIGSGNICGEK